MKQLCGAPALLQITGAIADIATQRNWRTCLLCALALLPGTAYRSDSAQQVGVCYLATSRGLLLSRLYQQVCTIVLTLLHWHPPNGKQIFS